MARKPKAEKTNSLSFTDESDRPTYKLKNGEIAVMSDKRIAAMQKHSWKEGESGNPAGRPPDPVETKMKMYQYHDEAIQTLRDIYKNGSNEGARVKAAMAFVTPFIAPAASKQEVDVNVNVNNTISKFLMMVTEDFEKEPGLLIEGEVIEPDAQKQ